MELKWGRPVDPTPVEIAIATAIIRMGWSEAEHRLRAGQAGKRRWKLPYGRIERVRFLLDEMRR